MSAPRRLDPSPLTPSQRTAGSPTTKSKPPPCQSPTLQFPAFTLAAVWLDWLTRSGYSNIKTNLQDQPRVVLGGSSAFFGLFVIPYGRLEGGDFRRFSDVGVQLKSCRQPTILVRSIPKHPFYQPPANSRSK